VRLTVVAAARVRGGAKEAVARGEGECHIRFQKANRK
jgi:hypothetical protein